MHTIDSDFDSAFTDRWFKYQKYAWLFVVLYLGASFSGVFGRGPAAHRTARTGAGLKIGYEKMIRDKTPSNITIYVPGGKEKSIRLTISGALVRQDEVPRIVPQPASEESTADGVVATIPLGPAGGQVALSQEASKVGEQTSTISVATLGSVDLTQIVFP